MGRRRKGPWKRKGQTKDDHWYTTIGKQTVKVADGSASYDQAFEKYVQILAESGEVEPEQLTFKNLVKRFLNWTKVNRSSATYAFYERYLNSFADYAGARRVTAVMPHHVEQWIERKFSHCSPTTKNDLMKAVATVIHWGIKRRFVKHNPIAGMDKPARKPRETVLTAEQFAQLLSFVNDQEFRDYLSFVWLTGCRAMEIRVLEKRHVDGNVITLPASEAKGGKHPRVIYLSDSASTIIKRLCEEHPTGPMFRTPDNRAWTANSVRLRFKRRTAKGKIVGLATKMGIPGLCATTLRHSWATNALKNGMDSTTASILMGHRDPATLIRNYQHLTQDSKYLTDAANSLPITLPPLDPSLSAVPS